MHRTRSLAAILVGVALFAVAGSAGANHGKSYHWARSANPATLRVVDSVVGEWDPYLVQVVADWHGSSVIDLVTEPGADSILDRTTCSPIAGTIRVCNAHYPHHPEWVGYATSYIQDGHIIQATAQLNDVLFATPDYNDPNAKRHVMCQEVGHTFGLGHTYFEPTCMDDKHGMKDPAFVDPGPHDFEQLVTLYTHLDAAGGGGPAPAARGAAGGSLVRVWREGDTTVVRYVLLARGASR